MMSVTVSMVSLILVMSCVISHGSRLWMVPLSGTAGEASVPESICTYLFPIRPSFWIEATESRQINW